MSRIDFGYSNDNNPTGMWEGMGASPNHDIINAEFMDVIKLNECVYLVSKVGMVFQGQENKIGTIDVREIVADLYPDGSGIIFANQEKSSVCTSLERSLSNAKTFLDKGMSIKEICGAYSPDKCYNFLLNNDGNSMTIVTGIKPNAFEKKKELISRCRGSFSKMQSDLMDAYAKLEEYENMYGNINRR